MTWLPDPVLLHLREACEAPDLTGTRYRILGELGRGGMGIVYLAEDSELGRQVALKVLDDRLEARILAQLEHPGIVPVHDIGTLPDGRSFYTMKRVAGLPLREWAAGDRSLAARLQLAQRLCETIAFAHGKGILHCDLKPDNIMTGPFGETLVMDWGLARSQGREASAVGTPGFMAPEQTRGYFDQRSDVYGLGGVLQFLLTPRAPRAVRAIAQKALAEDLSARYSSALEMRDDLARFLDGAPVLACPENLLEKGRRLLARHSTLALLILTYLVVRGVIFFWLGR